LCDRLKQQGDMTENDKAILRRWRDAEDRYKLFVASVAEDQGNVDRTPEAITEDAEAYLRLDTIEDPKLVPLVARLFQPLPDAYSSPAFQNSAKEHVAARDQLLAVAQNLDGVLKSTNRSKSQKRH
jgi:hypothetical protein